MILKLLLRTTLLLYNILCISFQNFDEALKCFKKSDELGNEKALLSLTALKWKTNKEADIIEDLLQGIVKYRDCENQAELYTQLGSCYILIRNDWENAIKYFIKCLELEPAIKYLKVINFN